MGLFSKKSSAKIPAPEDTYGQPQQQQYGARPPPPQGNMGFNGAGRPPPQQQYGAYNQPPPNQQYGAYNHPGPQGAYGTPQQSAMFRDAKPPSANFGQGYDEMMGGGRGGKNAALSRNAGPTPDDLEAEYGAGPSASASGYNSGRGNGGAYDGMEQQEQAQDEEDDEVEAIKQQMRFTKQESLSSTRNALRIARETEETATGTILKLGEQSDKIANTERHLDMSKAHSSRADDNSREIVALNRSIFRPHMQFNKKAKRDAEEARIMNRHIEEREEREQTRAEALKSQIRADQALTGAGTGSGRFTDRFGGGRFGGPKKPEDAQKNRLAQRGRYQFEATESDDDLEQELEDNLDEIGQLSGRLNQLGRAMGTEIDEQNSRIQRISEKANKLDTRVYGSTQKLERIK